MSSDDTKEKKNGDNKLRDALKELSPSSTAVDYIKRFFYQIIGIYFPASILFLYLFLFWFVGIDQDPLSYYGGEFRNGTLIWPEKLDDNLSQILQQNASGSSGVIHIVLFIVAIVILGEGINTVTSRFSILSPVTTTMKEAFKFSILNSPFPGISKDAGWPIWLNETSFPVSFAQFDRYYVSALEQDKRTLAGKIGWVSFYRNMLAIFCIILILQLILVFAPKFPSAKIHGIVAYCIFS